MLLALKVLGRFGYCLTASPDRYRANLEKLFNDQYPALWMRIWIRCFSYPLQMQCGYDMVVIELAGYYMLQYEKYSWDYVDDGYAQESLIGSYSYPDVDFRSFNTVTFDSAVASGFFDLLMILARGSDHTARDKLLVILKSANSQTVTAYLGQMRFWAREEDIETVRAVFKKFDLTRSETEWSTAPIHQERLLSALLKVYPGKPFRECDSPGVQPLDPNPNPNSNLMQRVLTALLMA